MKFFISALLFSFSMAMAQVPDPALINQVLNQEVSPEADCAPNEAPICTEQYVGTASTVPRICNDQRQNQNPFLAEYPDGSVVPNPYAVDEAMEAIQDEQDSKNQRPRPSSRATNPRLRSMFVNRATSPELVASFQASLDFMKNTVREQVTQGASEDSLHPHQRYLLERLDRLEVIYSSEGCNPADGDHPFNARYQGTSNTLYICPLLTHMSPESTMALLAHELGHFADPCNYARLYRFSQRILSNGDQDSRVRQITQEVGRCLSNVPATERRRFIDWATAPTRLQSRGLPIYVTDGENSQNQMYAERLRACGVVDAPNDPVPPRSYEGSPYTPLLSCINQRHSATRRPIAPNAAISPATCERRTVVAETVADYVASSVIARALNRNPERFPAQNRQHLPLFYTAVGCSNSADPEYLPSSERISVFLQSPAVQRGVGCEGSTLQRACPIPDSLTAERRAP